MRHENHREEIDRQRAGLTEADFAGNKVDCDCDEGEVEIVIEIDPPRRHRDNVIYTNHWRREAPKVKPAPVYEFVGPPNPLKEVRMYKIARPSFLDKFHIVVALKTAFSR